MIALNDFIQLTDDLVYKPKAIFPSELFLFYCKAKEASVDRIFESGVAFGGSTEYLNILFPDVIVTSIDKGKWKPRKDIVQGDGLILLPKFVSRSKHNRIAILIDGPKGKPAIRLAKKLLQFKKVCFVAVHDPVNGKVDSHDILFREQFGFLDEKVGVAIKKYPQGPGLRFMYA